MNCQEINQILDSLQPGCLAAGQRQQIESHVATCMDCARAWEAQLALAALTDEPMPADLPSQCLAAVSVRFPAAAPARRPGVPRVLIWGLVTAAAAATATYLGLLKVETPAAAAGNVLVPDMNATSQVLDPAIAVRPALAEEPALHLAEATASGSMQGPVAITVEVVVRESAPNEAGLQDELAAAPFTLEIHRSLRAALIGELRKVPGLTVVPDAPESVNPSTRHYRLQLAALLMVGVDGRPIRAEHQYNINLQVQEVQPGGAVVPHHLPIGFTVDPRATCTDPEEGRRKPCNETMTAALIVQQLRERVFPASPSEIRPLQAQLQDFSLPSEERFQAFVKLFKQQLKAGGQNLLGEPGMVRAAVELSQLTDAAHRAQLWRALRGIDDPQLIDALLASLQQDPRDARLAAVENLALDFSGHPRVRSALESAAASDPDSLVRGLARRGLDGEGAWQVHVTSSLKDPTLPASQRVEALLHVLYPPDTIAGSSDASPSNYWQILKDLDGDAVAALAEVFPRAEQLRKWPANNLIGNFASVHSRNPAVREMLLTVLESDTRALNRSVAGESLAQSHASDPRVRDALTRAASSDPDASVRDYLRQVLERDYVKKAMEAASR